MFKIKVMSNTSTPAPTYEDLLKRPEVHPSHTLDEWRLINVITGEVVWQRPRTPVFAQTDAKPIWVYQPQLVDELCAEIVNGGSLTLLCDGNKYPPYAQFCRWRRLHPEINIQLEEARRDRAERMRDLAIVEAMKAVGKNDTPAAQLKAEVHKWAAAMDDAKYRSGTKVDVALSSPSIIQVITGIERKEDVNTRTVEEVHAKSEDK